jgi:hypothetical protein
LFSGGDDLFSRVAAASGLHFGIFPELQITHLISASRLNRHYLFRLIHDHALSHGVLAYMLDGIQPQRIDLGRLVHLLLHAMKNGPFSARCQRAALQGADDAAQFISADRLTPLAYTSDNGAVLNWPFYAASPGDANREVFRLIEKENEVL